jgi:ADP-ribose pyrophosphatase YjhB (NUDIX family)
MAHARAAAGVLFFDEDGRVLLVRPSYKSGWDIPGGYLRPGETPSEAAAREVSEKLGIKPPIGRLLAADWAPHPDEGDKILFVFDGGQLSPECVAQLKPTRPRSPSTPTTIPHSSASCSFPVSPAASPPQ